MQTNFLLKGYVKILFLLRSRERHVSKQGHIAVTLMRVNKAFLVHLIEELDFCVVRTASESHAELEGAQLRGRLERAAPSTSTSLVNG